MKDIIVWYQGGSGGFFIYYYLLASDSNIVAKRNNLYLGFGQNKKMLDSDFYLMFQLNRSLAYWKQDEIWPLDDVIHSNNTRQIFLNCSSKLKTNLDASTSITINPYISDKDKWLKIQFAKRCWDFLDFPKNNYSEAEAKNFYNKIYEITPKNSKIQSADYHFDFLQFLQDKNQRQQLCDRLNIQMNSRMEDYLSHYIKCHGTFYHKLTH